MGTDGINKPSSSELAKEDYNKNVRSRDSAQTFKSGQQANRQVKEKSAFEKVLDNLTQSSKTAEAEESKKFDTRLRDVLSDDNKKEDKDHSSKKEDKTDDKKNLKSDSESKETGRSSKDGAIKDRVLGKQGSGGEKSGTGGGGSEGQSSSKQFGQRQFKETASMTPGMAGTVQKTGEIQSAFAAKAAQTSQAGQVPKVILDQIVQYVRIGLNKNLDKEMQVDLSDKIFKGLSLKVSSHQGKVEVTFLTGNADVRRLFEGQKNRIADALKEKSIQVSNIKVQFLG